MEEEPARGRLKVIYVMGAGHSGSTILGVTLGNCAGAFYAGEVEEWLVKSGKPFWGGSERARFWAQVSAEVDAEGLFGAEVNRRVERSSAALRIDLWPARLRLLRRYRRVAQALLQAIGRSSGSSAVIDTSHFPLRAHQLQKLSGIELYVILLVRDPQSVVASNLRELSPHEVAERRWRTLTMNANLFLTQLLAVLVFLRQPRARRLFVRHEEFLADPERVLREILDMVGSTAAIPDLSALRIGVPLQGNRLMRAQTIALERSTAAVTRSSLLTALLQLPWSCVLSRLRPAVALGGSRGAA